MAAPTLGTRVKISTQTGGCYHNHTGTVCYVLNTMFQDITSDPTVSDPVPRWFRVKLDDPANNGGTLVQEEIFLPHELSILP